MFCFSKPTLSKVKFQRISQRSFSFFENYSKTSQIYDNYRRALGIPEITLALQSLHANSYHPMSKNFVGDRKAYDFPEFVSDLHILDAGCGTGNYIKSMVDLGVGYVTGLEFNEGMLAQCQQKCTDTICTDIQNKRFPIKSHQCVRLRSGNIVEMPFKQSSFDVVMINLVLQHVDNDSTRNENFLNIRTVLERCLNVINDNGLLLITTHTPQQLAVGLWYSQFFPNAIQKACKMWCEMDWWSDEILKCGFSEVSTCKLCDTLVDFDKYYDFEGIFKKEWRDAYSTFALISDEELQVGLQTISETVLVDAERKNLFFKECEKVRMDIGLGTLVIARKK